jgi:transaldolase/glucose-6-phosphate isomerase
VASVASFFVSRVDTKVDKLIDARLAAAATPADRDRIGALRGRAAIANSKLAYEHWAQLHKGARWEQLVTEGARPQRCLWASTSTKNPRYRDTMYVEELIGPATVNTMPPATFEAFRDHGRVELTLQKDLEGARHVLDQLAMYGIDLAAITQELEDEGVAGFAKSYRESIEHLSRVRAAT